MTKYLVFRGGSWLNSRENARCAYRLGNYSDFRGDTLGFRLAKRNTGNEYLVLRGGSRLFNSKGARCASRDVFRPVYRNYYLGFRLARRHR